MRIFLTKKTVEGTMSRLYRPDAESKGRCRQGAAVQDIEAVLFDWGGVLIDNPAAALMDYCARSLGVPTQDYTRAHNKYGEAFQKGWIPEDLFWRQVCSELSRPLPQTPSLWGQAFRAAYSPREEVFALAGGLHAGGYRVTLLSNTEGPAMEFFLELRYEMFDAPIFSCAEGACKPQKEIYEIAARRLRIPAGRCVLIDDKPVFVGGARKAGMAGIVYESLEQVKQDLATFGVRA
jgi:FMN phosphatase YigB (HAD superfamily)